MPAQYKNRKCEICGTLNKNVPYSPSAFFNSAYHFRCHNCHNIND